MIGLAIGTCALCVGGAVWAAAAKPPRTPAQAGRQLTGETAKRYPGRPDVPVPWLPGAVDCCARSGISNGIHDPDALVVFVLAWAYPMDDPNFWPYQGDDPELRRLQARVALRTNRILATAADEAAERNIPL